MSHAYATASLSASLADVAFTWSSAYATNRARLGDGLNDVLAASASSAQASGQTLAINLGSAQAVVGIALLNHNLASGACTVLVEAGTDGVTFGTVAKAATTIVTTSPNHKDTVLQFPSATKQYWRLTFVHTGTKILTFGEVQVLGTITTLSRTTVYGAGESERYVLNRNEARSGAMRSTFVAGPIRTKQLPFKDLVGTAQRNELMGMWRATQGGNANLLWIDFVESTATAATAAAQECLWGKLSESLGWTQPDYALYDVDGLTLVGLGREVGS